MIDLPEFCNLQFEKSGNYSLQKIVVEVSVSIPRKANNHLNIDVDHHIIPVFHPLAHP